MFGCRLRPAHHFGVSMSPAPFARLASLRYPPMGKRLSFALLVLGVLCVAGPWSGPAPQAEAQTGDIPFDHVIDIYLENHSFDNLFGLFPGADGLANAKQAPPQADPDGSAYATLPQPRYTSAVPPVPDPAFPSDLPNQPFPIDGYVPQSLPIPD